MVLITGFEPFTTGQGLVLTHNPTADIVARVAEKMPHVAHAVLPVSFQKTRAALLALFEEYSPRIWIGLGYAPHRETLDIETIALNLEHAERGDNDGERPWMRPIIEGAPTAYQTRLDVEDAIEIFAHHGVTATASCHGGTFLCNQTFYLACHQCDQATHLKIAAFIHLPPMDETTHFERGLQALIEALL
jgi:pyroglutamyl-peptidase